MDNQENGQTQQENARLNESIKELLREKHSLDPSQCPNAMRLLDDEIGQCQAKGKPSRDTRYVDIYRERPVRVSVKVLVPVKEHPRFNFVGKLLGPKGNSLKRLQEETMTRMAILGRGSMRDKQKEEEWRNTLDPKYSHLSEELHVEITALAAPAEAYARIAFALAEIRKYLVPDSNDEIRQEQLREIQSVGGGRGGGGPPERRPQPAPLSRQPRGGGHPRAMGGGGGGPGKGKVISILDRARVAMEDPGLGEYGYDDGMYDQAPAPPSNYGSDFNGQGDYYDAPASHGGGRGAAGGGPRWKGFKSAVSNRGYGSGGARPAPYARAPK